MDNKLKLVLAGKSNTRRIKNYRRNFIHILESQ